MPVRYDRPVSHSAFLARRLGGLSFLILVAVLLAHRFGPLTTPDLVALLAGAALLAAIAVPLALIGLARLWHVGAVGGVAAGRALLLSAPVLLLVGYGAYLYHDRPPIYDVTTDAGDLPRWISEPQSNQQWLPRPPVTQANRSEQAAAYPALTGRRYEGALDRVYQAVTKIARLNGITVTATRGHEALLPEFAPLKEDEPELAAGAPAPPLVIPIPQPRPQPPTVSAVPAEPSEPPGVIRVQGETRTLVLGFRFDVLIRLREEAETTLVDIRVASRFGPHDLGMGAEIATGYLHALDAELLGIAGD